MFLQEISSNKVQCGKRIICWSKFCKDFLSYVIEHGTVIHIGFLLICLSVTHWYCIEMVEPMINQGCWIGAWVKMQWVTPNTNTNNKYKCDRTNLQFQPLSHYVITRKLCCCRELPCDAGCLYRKLAPNLQAMQWIETTLKLLANIVKHGEVVKKNTLQVHQWRTDACRRMVSRDSRTKVHDIRGTSLAKPLTRPNFGQKVCEISVVKKFCQSSPYVIRFVTSQ